MLVRNHTYVLLLAVTAMIGCSPGLVTEDDKTDAVAAKAKAEEAAKPKYSDGAVVQAALEGKMTVIERALQDGNALEAVNQEGFSALHTAAFGGHLKIVKLLLEKGADLEQLGGGEKKMNALHTAAYNGHDHVVRFLLDKGMKVDERDGEGKSALIHASSGPFEKATTLLLDSGADVNLADQTEGFTALMMAAAEGQTEIVKLLLSRGADPTMVDVDTESALTFAMQKRHGEIVQMLTEAMKPADSEPAAEKDAAE